MADKLKVRSSDRTKVKIKTEKSKKLKVKDVFSAENNVTIYDGGEF